MATTESIKFNTSNWKVRINERRNNRMKLQVNLSKEESEAFKNFTEMCKPQEVSDHDFIKTLFYMGIEAANARLAEMVQDYAKLNKEELAASGITVVEEDGGVRLEETKASAEEE
jgi:hypothetical protein